MNLCLWCIFPATYQSLSGAVSSTFFPVKHTFLSDMSSTQLACDCVFAMLQSCCCKCRQISRWESQNKILTRTLNKNILSWVSKVPFLQIPWHCEPVPGKIIWVNSFKGRMWGLWDRSELFVAEMGQLIAPYCCPGCMQLSLNLLLVKERCKPCIIFSWISWLRKIFVGHCGFCFCVCVFGVFFQRLMHLCLNWSH